MRALRILSLAAMAGPIGVASPEIAAGQAQLVLVDGAPEAASRRWERSLEGATGGAPSLTEWVLEAEPVSRVAPERLEVISLIETLLMRARHAASRLLERDALNVLLRAESLAQSHLDVPGMASWYAEVQLAIAITAAQSGLGDLSTAALRRSASVDPTRGVQAAEARPDVVERGQAAIRRAATGPRGRFEVRANVPGAVVILDDHRFGVAPQRVQVVSGTHVLRVEAAGHRSYARLIHVLEGDRPPVDIRLSESSRLSAATRALEGARLGDPEAVSSALGALGSDAPNVWMVWPRAERAVIVRCEAERCDAPRRLLAEDGTANPLQDEPEGNLPSALAWLDRADPTTIATPERWWELWYVWAAVGAAVLAGAAAIAVAASPQGPPPLLLVVDIEGLPRASPPD